MPRVNLDIYDDRRPRPRTSRGSSPMPAMPVPLPVVPRSLEPAPAAAPPPLGESLEGLDAAFGEVSALVQSELSAGFAALAHRISGLATSLGAGEGRDMRDAAAANATSSYQYTSTTRTVGADGAVTERVVETTRVGDGEAVTRTTVREGGGETVTVQRGDGGASSSARPTAVPRSVAEAFRRFFV